MSSPVLKIITIAALSFSSTLFAHTFTNKGGSYDDNNGLTRSRYHMGLDLTFDQFNRDLSSATMNISAIQDRYEIEHQDDDDSLRHSNTSLSLGLGQTWKKVFETRQIVALSSDKELGARTQTYGGGVGYWFLHDTLRLNLDFIRSIVRQPNSEYLDYDSQLVSLPRAVSSKGYTVSVRHLATKTTIVDYSFAYFTAKNRPDSQTYGLNIKQFVPVTNSAVHAGVARAENRGTIQPDTSYGEVDAWEANLAYLQTLWKGATGRLGYKYYIENQTTRAYKDELLFGSDLYSLNLSQELGPESISSLRYPIILDVGASVYKTNKDNTSLAIDNSKKITARIYEAGLSAKF